MLKVLLHATAGSADVAKRDAKSVNQPCAGCLLVSPSHQLLRSGRGGGDGIRLGVAAPCEELRDLTPLLLLRRLLRLLNPPPLLHTLVMAHSSKNIRLAFFSKPHAANTGSATMKQKSSSTSGHHANVPGLFFRTRCTYTAQHANRLPAIHGRFGRYATHIPLTMNSRRASSTFMPPGTGHCSVCLCESVRETSRQ